MPVVMVVIAGPASNLGRLAIHQRYDGMVRNTAALYTVIVNDIA